MEEINGKIPMSDVDKEVWLNKTFKNCEVMQYFSYMSIGLDEIKNILDTWQPIKDYAIVVHDRDVWTKADEEKNPDHKAGTVKDSHFHLALRFKENNPQKLRYIAEKFMVEPQFVNKIRCGFPKMLAYLIHQNAPDKFQYPTDDVISNFDWEVEKDQGDRVNQIITGINNGEITRSNYTDKITMFEFVTYKRHIENAFKYDEDRKRKVVNRNMECIYITGTSGSGKSTYAKMIAEKHGYDVFISSSTNDVLDGYVGEECVILDDLRGSAMAMSDLLKLLDNNTNTSVKSRYYNKVLTKCKLIIITTVKPIEEFYKGIFENEDEPIVQLKRRCKLHIRLTEDRMYISVYNKATRSYGNEKECDNPIDPALRAGLLTDDEENEYIDNMLGMDIKSVSAGKPINEAFVQIKLTDNCPFV